MRDWLIKARKNKCLSQRALADMVGVTDVSVQAWEKGKSTPYLGHQGALGRILEIDVRSLFERESERREVAS